MAEILKSDDPKLIVGFFEDGKPVYVDPVSFWEVEQYHEGNGLLARDPMLSQEESDQIKNILEEE